MALDVSNQISIEKAVAQVIKNEGKIDILVNNAGQSCTMPAAEVEVDRMRQAFEANFFGLVAVTNQGIDEEREDDGGRVDF